MLSELTLYQLLLITAFIVLVPLAAYTAYLFHLLYRQRRARRLAEEENNKKLEQRRTFARESVITLLQALRDQHDQLSTTEAAIRITALCQILPLTDDEIPHHRAFANLADATSHIPILDKWKQLSRQEQNELEKQRLSIEKAHQQTIEQAVSAWLEVLDK